MGIEWPNNLETWDDTKSYISSLDIPLKHKIALWMRQNYQHVSGFEGNNDSDWLDEAEDLFQFLYDNHVVLVEKGKEKRGTS